MERYKMNVELKFRKDDIETKNFLINELGISEDSFMEIRAIDGSAIILVVLIAIDLLVKKPNIIDKFLKRDGCEIEFDEQGNLLRARGYTIGDIIKLKSSINKEHNQR